MKKLILKITMTLFGVLVISIPMAAYGTETGTTTVPGNMQMNHPFTCMEWHLNSGCTLEGKPHCKPDNTPEAKPDNTPEVKPDNTPEIKPDDTPEVKPDNTPEIKPDDTPEVKPDNTPEMDESTVNTYENKVAELVNTKRREAGLQPLAINKALSKVAEKKAEDMANQNYFSHTSPTYGSPFEMMKQFGINYKAAGENIAKGQRTPESVMTGWMNSEGHRANIMSTNYTEIGIGYVVDAKGDTYWVQMFIRP